MTDQPWDAIERVDDLPQIRKQFKSKYDPLVEELLLRLERTPKSQWLRIPCKDVDTARRVYSGIQRRLKLRCGLGFVEISLRANGDNAGYVRRGATYSK